MLIIKSFLFSLLIFSPFQNFSKDSTTFISPVTIPLYLSANFGELRSDHFHSGIDIKTQGVVGKEVVAAADGYVYRIGVLPGGFGKTLYVRHASGYSTVYAHLDRFIPVIDEYVLDEQYRTESFQVNLYPTKDQFVFKQGELIGYAGNSGSSTGPHLHYEIRDSRNENPVDPLQFAFGIKDTRKPIFEKLIVYPMDEQSVINGKNSKKTFNIEGDNGEYYIHPDNKIVVNGTAGFGIKAYDLLNGASNKCGIHSMEMSVDGNPVYKYVLDEYSYDETKYVNSHIDYETLQKEKYYVQELFTAPNDKLSIYGDIVNNGRVSFSDNLAHRVVIVVKDSHGNSSSLAFNFQNDTTATAITTAAPQNFVMMPFNTTNVFRAENINVSIPSGSLYDSLRFVYNVTKGDEKMYSDLHRVHDIYTPIHKSFTLKIRPKTVPSGKESKLLIVKLDNSKRKNPLKTELTSDGFLTASASGFGDYFVDIDTVPPRITPQGNINGETLSGKKEIRIKITDDLSGIKSYVPVIDGKWAMFEFDQKNEMLIYQFDKARIQKSGSHKLVLTVTDNVGNTKVYEAEFKW